MTSTVTQFILTECLFCEGNSGGLYQFIMVWLCAVTVDESFVTSSVIKSMDNPHQTVLYDRDACGKIYLGFTI